MRDKKHVLVIGSAGMDVTGHPQRTISPICSQGHIHISMGGVARNIAENLARLEVPTVLLSAIGKDDVGTRVIRHCKESGIACSHVRVVTGAHTMIFMALVDENGDPYTAVSDSEVLSFVDTPYILSNERLFASASMIVIDAMISDDAMATVFELAERYHVHVCADPTSPGFAPKLQPYISRLYLVTPNAAETTALCGLDNPAHDWDTAVNAARHLVTLGAEIAVVTLSEKGLAYADKNGGGFIRAIRTHVVDPSGAGDALTGAVIFGLLNEVTVDEAMRLGTTAASLTLQSTETVLPEISQELLYDKLMV